MVKSLGKEDSIDRSYYDKLTTGAVKSISEHGDYEWFVSDDPYIPVTYPSDLPRGINKRRTSMKTRAFDLNCLGFSNSKKLKLSDKLIAGGVTAIGTVSEMTTGWLANQLTT